jgi:putative SOS response-associated peptidase YedK
MCYDISFSSGIELITDYLPGIDVDPQIRIDYDTSIHVIAHAYRKYPVIIYDNGYRLKPFEWGLIADYMNTPEKIKKSRSFMCNAQSEKILDDKRSVWHRLRQQRCLIPVTGILEHREIQGWKNKVPYHVKLKERPLFCIPGLYNYSPLPDVETGEVTGTFTLITRAANPLMMQIHNGGDNKFRMPLFLPKELELKWLDPALTDDEMRSIINYEMPSGELEYYTTFSIRARKERPDGKGKIEPFVWEGLPELNNK